LSVVERLTGVAADPQHCVTVVTAQALAVEQNAAQCVPLHDVHALLAEVARIGRRRFTQDQRLGILQRHNHTQLDVRSDGDICSFYRVSL